MTVITGKLGVKLPGHQEWIFYTQGSSFRVEPNQKFRVTSDVDTAYWCMYK
jgi:uncharacterized protein YaiE (UPF0345 family)